MTFQSPGIRYYSRLSNYYSNPYRFITNMYSSQMGRRSFRRLVPLKMANGRTATDYSGQDYDECYDK
ncbi:hypothetical protein B9Z55_000503 [Caenorhabditis nigoni]|uniref:Uncharacterized protein n=1 Tax=Caenorhabditis nigoni TaxID=1611254 RepID=A0A2G5VTF7_9PELO|nr:hypothetical protein B9Z55_000503 [Caenorhabditis nigoni]